VSRNIAVNMDLRAIVIGAAYRPVIFRP